MSIKNQFIRSSGLTVSLFRPLEGIDCPVCRLGGSLPVHIPPLGLLPCRIARLLLRPLLLLSAHIIVRLHVSPVSSVLPVAVDVVLVVVVLISLLSSLWPWSTLGGGIVAGSLVEYSRGVPCGKV